jgi:dihydropyrimidine dehydrogenase (NAD+) subunit PreT
MSEVITKTYLDEAESGFTHRTAMEEASRCLLCHDAPCSAGCPAGTDPGKFIRSIRFRNPKGAAETIRENNIFGGSCARVCPYGRLCEEACSRCGIDRPIQIGKLQRYAIEQEKTFGLKTLKAPAEKSGAKVACIGAGPASLACAAELAKAGISVTVCEREAKAGGVLTYGISPLRLPQEVVDHDVSMLDGLGIEIKTGEAFDGNYEALLGKGYDAVFAGIGLWQPKMPDLPGTDLPGVYSAVDFLKYARTKGGADMCEGKNVVVIGGGDVAMDCALTAKLSGAKTTAIWYRRSIAEAPASMPEILYNVELGIAINTNFAPAEVVAGADGKAAYMVFNSREGEGGAKAPADVIIFAVGQAPECEDTAKGNLPEGVFAGGDITNGGKTVVQAVADGKEAAAKILSYLEKKGVK